MNELEGDSVCGNRAVIESLPSFSLLPTLFLLHMLPLYSTAYKYLKSSPSFLTQHLLLILLIL